MLHPSVSELQRDDRQDEFPTTYRGNQDEFPTTYHVHPVTQYRYISALPTNPSSTKNLIFGLRKKTFWLSLLAATILVLGVVGSSVAGSVAMNRKHSLDNIGKPGQSAQAGRSTTTSASAPSHTLDPTTTPLQPSRIDTISASASSHTLDPTTTPLQPSPVLSSPTSTVQSHSTRAISDCQNVQTPYTAKIFNSALFDISCETQNYGGDFMSLESSTLQDCIDACANFNFWTAHNSYNSNIKCSIINYDSYSGLSGNCWLKESGHPQPATFNQSVISASLRGGN